MWSLLDSLPLHASVLAVLGSHLFKASLASTPQTVPCAGKYCGRFTDLPAREQLIPVVGLQCGSFVFRWRCGATAGNSNAKGGDRSTANIDGMMIREQMLQEDAEMPWLCKVGSS